MMTILIFRLTQLVKAYQRSQFGDFEAKLDELSIHTMNPIQVSNVIHSTESMLASIQPQRSYRILNNIKNNICDKRSKQNSKENIREASAKKQLQKIDQMRTSQLTKLVMVYCGIFVILYQLLKSPFDDNDKEIHNDVQYFIVWGVFLIFTCLFGVYYRKIASYNVQFYTISVNMPMDPNLSITYSKLKQCTEQDEAKQNEFINNFKQMQMSFYQFNRIQILVNLLDSEQPQEKRLLDVLLPILQEKKNQLQDNLSAAIELACTRFKKVIHFSEENVKLFIILAAILYEILKFYRQTRSSKGDLLDRTVRDTVTGIILTIIASIIIGLYWFFNVYIKIWRTMP